jgi:hypothetical protein
MYVDGYVANRSRERGDNIADINSKLSAAIPRHWLLSQTIRYCRIGVGGRLKTCFCEI